MSFCPECGARLDSEARFCAECGTALAVSTQPQGTVTSPIFASETDERHWATDAQGHPVGPGAAGPPLSHDPTFPTAAAGNPRSRGTTALLGGVVVLALAILGGTVAVFASHNTGGGQPQPVASPVAAATTSGPATPTTTITNTTETFPVLYRQVSDGVVRIETTACNAGGVGSGFLLAPTLVATVAHVVDGAVSIVVRDNGIITTGTVIGIDTHADLALVQTHTPLSGHVFTLDTSQPEVGTDVGAIGYPLGGQESLTKGSISGLGRTIDVGNGPLGGLIQTDTPVNHGNSGGPLLSADGTVVGLVDAMETGANGIGYAIPAQTAATQLQGWQEAPTPVPAGSGCAAPVGPTGVRVNVSDQSGSPDGLGISAMFATYANGINTGNYSTAYGLLSPYAQSLTSFDAFSQGEASSYNVTLSVSAVTHTGNNDSAEVTFTSVQDPAAGGTGQACSNWSMTYTLIPNGASWLIDTASPHPGSPAPC
jgi:serine protease Do